MATKKLARDLGLIRCRKTQRDGSLKANKKGQVFEYIFVIDFESTCWDRGQPQKSQEIIEFPAVLLQMSSGHILAEFQHYVLPFENPKLSDFCTELTGITQEQVDCGVPLQTCLALFTRWVRDLSKKYNFVFSAETTSEESSAKRAAFATWSDWDLGVCLQYECRRKQLRKPDFFNRWMDIRALYRKFYSRRPQGLHGALQDLGLKFDGRQHSGICDARNTASLITRMACDGCIFEITKKLTHDFKVNARNERMNCHVFQIRKSIQDKRTNQEMLLPHKKHKKNLQPCVPKDYKETDVNSYVIGISLQEINADELLETNTNMNLPVREVNGQNTSSVFNHSVRATKVFIRQASRKVMQKINSSSSHTLTGSYKDDKCSVGRYTNQKSPSPKTLISYNSNSDSSSMPPVTSIASGILLPSATCSSNILSSTTSSSNKLLSTTSSISVLPSTAFSNALPSTSFSNAPPSTTSSSNVLPSTSSISALPTASISSAFVNTKSSSSSLPSTTSSSSVQTSFSTTTNPYKVVVQKCLQGKISSQPSTSSALQSCSGAVVEQRQCKSNNSLMKKTLGPASSSERSGPEHILCKAPHHSEVASVTVAPNNDNTPKSRFRTPTILSETGFLSASSVHDAPNTQFRSPLMHLKAASVHTSPIAISASNANHETPLSSKVVSVLATTDMSTAVNKQIRIPLEHSKAASVPMSSRISSILRQRQCKTPLLHSKSFSSFTSPDMGSTVHRFKTPLSHFRSHPRLSASTMSIIPPNEASQFKKTPPFCGCGRRARFHITDKPGPNQGRGFFACPNNFNSPKNCSFFRWEDQGSASSNKSFAQISPVSKGGHQVSMMSVQTSSTKHITP